MTNKDFDRLLDSIRESQPDPAALADAAGRVRDRLATGSIPDLCVGFRADFDAYRHGRLSEARRMLVEDHLHTCVACRHEYHGADKAAVVVPIRRGVAKRIALWTVAAAAAAALTIAAAPLLDRALAPSGPRGTVASVEGSLVLVSDEGTKVLAAGSAIDEGQEIRTGPGSHAVIRLRDGSTVEMAERSDLSLTELWRSKTVHLDRGDVIVEAAKQGRGRLEIATADCLVTVKGTIFGVSRGLKGSRVSVVEGAVQVDEVNGVNALLHRGEQAVTHESLQRTAVSTEISWSENAAKYLALLADFDAVQREISQIPLPGLRYSSNLLDRVPADTHIFVSVPNLSQTLAEATRVVENRASQSPALAEWWNGAGAQIRQAIANVQEFSDYLGDEVVLAGPGNGNAVMILAEVRRDGLPQHLQQLGFTDPLALDGNLIALNAAAVPPPSQFTSTPFGSRVLASYRAGAGLLFAADMEQIVSSNVPSTNVDTAAAITGIDSLRFLIAESKTNLGAQENTATFTFSGARHGIASWLAAPGPMGTLEFVSPEATFASSFVTRDPRAMIEELLAAGGPQASGWITDFQRASGVNPLDDIAGTLGGEATLAFDGALLPVPSWKLAVEVQSPDRLQTAVETVLATAQAQFPDSNFSVTSETVDGHVYYAASLDRFSLSYTYVDGYLLAGSTRALLMAAISNRAAALTLPRSDQFRAQMPLDGHQNFSGILYYNLGSVVGPLADQLKSSGLLTPEQETAIAGLTANRAPSLVYVYSGTDQILVGSRSGLLDLGLQAMASLASGNPLGFLPMTGLGGPQ